MTEWEQTIIRPFAPKGMGLYIRAFQKRHGTPNEFAKKLADNGLLWSAIGGPWHDGSGDRWINSPDTIKRYAEAMARHGVTPHIWGYPWHGRINTFVDELQSCMIPEIEGWLHDPELGLKNHPEDARLLVKRSREQNPYYVIGFTSYGLPRGHGTFPFDEFAEPDVYDPVIECDYGSPQLYDTPPKRILEGMREYSELGFDVVIPSFGNYKFVKKDPTLPLRGSNRRAVSLSADELTRHLNYFMESEVPVNAMIGWAENFVHRAQWRVIAEHAELLNAGNYAR